MIWWINSQVEPKTRSFANACVCVSCVFVCVSMCLCASLVCLCASLLAASPVAGMRNTCVLGRVFFLYCSVSRGVWESWPSTWQRLKQDELQAKLHYSTPSFFSCLGHDCSASSRDQRTPVQRGTIHAQSNWWLGRQEEVAYSYGSHMGCNCVELLQSYILSRSYTARERWNQCGNMAWLLVSDKGQGIL